MRRDWFRYVGQGWPSGGARRHSLPVLPGLPSLPALAARAPTDNACPTRMGPSIIHEPVPFRTQAAWEFSNSRACRDQSRLITGHGLMPARLHMCATSPCRMASHSVGKGTGCGPRRLRPLEARLPRCAISPLGFFAGPVHDAPCEFRLLGHEGAGEDSGWRLLVDSHSATKPAATAASKADSRARKQRRHGWAPRASTSDGVG